MVTSIMLVYYILIGYYGLNVKFYHVIKKYRTNFLTNNNNMKKVQITTIEKIANIQIIELNASFIARVVRLQAQLEPLVENITRTKRKFNDETKKYEDVLDENGNKVIEYDRVDGKILAETVLPFFNEIVEAFEE